MNSLVFCFEGDFYIVFVFYDLDDEMYHINGFTIIELILVVAIVGVLAAISFPLYQGYVIRGNRMDAKTALATVAMAQERYYSVSNQYAANVASLGIAAGLREVNEGRGTTLSGYYSISIENVSGAPAIANGGPYLLRATPTTKGGQSSDVCNQLTLSSMGKKDIASAAAGLQWVDCW